MTSPQPEARTSTSASHPGGCSEIEAWDNLTEPDWWGRGVSHGYVAQDATSFRPACTEGLSLWKGNLCEGGRLQRHIPELPLCPECAEIAGLTMFRTPDDR